MTNTVHDADEDGRIGAIEYHNIGINETAQTQDFYKYGQEYTDCALEEIKPRPQREEDDDDDETAEEGFLMQNQNH